MRVILFEASPVNVFTTLTNTVRMTSADAPSLVTADSVAWIPAVTENPTRTITFSQNGQPSPATVEYSSVKFNISNNPEWSDLWWDGALARMWVGEHTDTSLASFTKIFEGRLGPISVDGKEAEVALFGNESALDTELLSATYAGTGNAEGPAEMLGTFKPWTSGSAQNVAPIEVNRVYWIYQYHGYGATEAVDAVYENCLSLGAPHTTVTTYAALQALSLPDGTWAAAPAIGMFRIANEPTGKITCDVRGAKDGATYASSLGSIAIHMLKLSGISTSYIDSTSLSAFTETWDYHTTNQVSIYDVVSNAFFQAGGYLFTNEEGIFKAGRYISTKTPIALTTGEYRTEPYVISVKKLPALSPVWSVEVGYDRCWSTHSDNEISDVIKGVQADLTAATTLAQDAFNDAAQAQADANIANARLASIANDNVLDRVDKAALNREWDQLSAELSGNQSTASGLGITTELGDYNAAYAATGNYLLSLSPAYHDTSSDTTIVSATFKQKFADLHYARQVLLNKIAQVAATRANWDGVVGLGKPADYATADTSLYALGTVTPNIRGNTVIKNGGGVDFNSAVRSDAVTGAAWASANIASSAYTMVGFDTSPSTYRDSESEFYIQYEISGGGAAVYLNGAFHSSYTLAANLTGKVHIEYTGDSYLAYVAGQQVGPAFPAPANLTVYPKWYLYNPNVLFSGLAAGRGVALNKNLVDLGWWKRDATIPWTSNGPEYNRIISVGTDTSGEGFLADSEDAWYCQEVNNDGGQSGGWDYAPTSPLDRSKTYRFVVPVRRIGGTASVYWGTANVCDLNTTTVNPNPYFTGNTSLVLGTRYLMVGYIYPAGSTGRTHTSAGIWNCETGQKLEGGTNYCFSATGNAPYHRAYQYYSSSYASLIFGKPLIELADGSESSLNRYFSAYALLNSNQLWKEVSGDGRPSDYATADLKLIASATSGAVPTITGNTIHRPVGSDYTGQVYSQDGYTGGAFCSFSPSSHLCHFAAGLNTDPLTDANFTSIDYCFAQSLGSNVNILESGVYIGEFGAGTAGNVLSITYDNEYVRYSVNGVVVRSVKAPANKKFFFDSALVQGDPINNVRFGPQSASASGITFVSATGKQEQIGNSVSKKAGAASSWDDVSYSKETYTSGAVVTAKLDTTGTFIGLRSLTETVLDFYSLRYSIHRSSNGSWAVYESGAYTGLGTSFNSDTIWTIAYDNVDVKYYANGVQVRTISAPTNFVFQAGVCCHNAGDLVSGITFSSNTDNAWSNVGGAGKPEDYATVGARAGVNLRKEDTTLISDPDFLNARLQGNVLSLPQVGGGAVSVGGTANGALKILLPAGIDSTMVKFMVDIYEYGVASSVRYEIGGYPYSPSNGWINVTATATGSSTYVRPVFFGRDADGRFAIWIGNYGQSWSYPSAVISNFQASYSGYGETTWKAGWNMSFTTTAPWHVNTSVAVPTAGDALVGINTRDASGNLLSDVNLRNEAQRFDYIVGGYGKPEDNATVGAQLGVNFKRGSGTVVNDAAVLNENQQLSQVIGAGTLAGLNNLALDSGYLTGELPVGKAAAALRNSGITIASNGTISGAGGGQVTIGGLGYTGALDATKNVGALADLNAVNLDSHVTDGSTYKRYEGAERSKLTGIEALADVTATSVPFLDITSTAAFLADYTGALKAGQVDRVIYCVRWKGSTNVTTSSSWSITTSGCTASIGASTGILTITAVAAAGFIDVVAAKSGEASLYHRISITKTLDSPPSGGGGGGATSAYDDTIDIVTSYSYVSANAGPLTVRAGSAGTVNLYAPLTFFGLPTSGGGATNTLYGKWQWRTVGGSWADVASEIASNSGSGYNASRYYDADFMGFTNFEGYTEITMSKTSLTNGTDYEFQLLLRYSSGYSTETYGTATAVAS